MTKRRVAIVGAGQAGLSVAMNLRQKGFEGAVALIGDEAMPPYQRPPLSKAFLLGKLDHDRVLLKPRAFYEEQRIDLRLCARVEALDLPGRELVLPDGRVSFDDLVLATGTAPRRLTREMGGDLEGVFYLRTAADAERLGPELVEGRRLVMIGGGYIGLEVAAVARERGLDVTVIEAAARILQRVAAPETSDYFRDLHERRGVRVIEGVGLRTLRGERRVSGAELADGRVIDADIVVVGIGVVPRTRLAAQAGLALENGIRVDKSGRTSVNGVWAVGDCCSFPYQGQTIRLESVPHAVDQGAILAENILGGDAEYRARPWFWSDQYNVKLQTAGLNSGYDQTFLRRADSSDSASVWYFRNGRTIAVDAMNDARTYMAARKWLQQDQAPGFMEVTAAGFRP